MVGPSHYAGLSGLEVVGGEALVAECGSFGSLDPYELHSVAGRRLEIDTSVVGGDVHASYGIHLPVYVGRGSAEADPCGVGRPRKQSRCQKEAEKHRNVGFSRIDVGQYLHSPTKLIIFGCLAKSKEIKIQYFPKFLLILHSIWEKLYIIYWLS